ncbi:hypothetical protein B6D29_04900 [Microgenomates bacterium UTCPR1]|nr:MAG: hypothetical protein B6D29_04900 [Microgenomates bacterium UTCPR1]
MANFLKYKEKQFRVGDTLSVHYKIKDGDRERVQLFKGILIKVRGETPETKMFTVRRVTKEGKGIERIIPVMSRNISDIVLIKKTTYTKAKAYFLQGLSDQELRKKLYQTKKSKKSK